MASKLAQGITISPRAGDDAIAVNAIIRYGTFDKLTTLVTRGEKLEVLGEKIRDYLKCYGMKVSKPTKPEVESEANWGYLISSMRVTAIERPEDIEELSEAEMDDKQYVEHVLNQRDRYARMLEFAENDLWEGGEP
jgi:hypothetical protein